MKRTSWIGLTLLLAAAAAAWWGTREEKHTGIVVTVETLTNDGPLPLPLFARPLQITGAVPIEMVPVPGQPRTFRAPGTTRGHYDFFNEAGWRFINDGRPIPLLEPGDEPAHVSMGRPCCIYVRPQAGAGFFLESIAAVERVEGKARSETFHPVKAEVVSHPEGWFGIRLPPEACRPRARFRISGWLSGRHPFDPTFVDFPSEDVRRPYTRVVRPASVARLRIVLVGGPAAQMEGVEIEAALRGLPIDMTDRVRTNGGVATFPSLGAFAQGLELRVPSWGPGAAYRLSVDRWRREGTVFLRAPNAQADVRVPLVLPEGATVENVAIVDGAMDRFALAPLERAEDGWAVRASPGPQTWVVYAGDKATALEVDVRAGEPVTISRLEDAVKVHGKLDIRGAGYRVRFLRAVDDRWVGGHGMEVDVRGARYEATLPAGRYRVVVVQPGGRLGRPLTLTWAAGTNAELPLDAK